MKKRGFGVGKWNGVGGKIDSAKGDRNVVDAAIRESEEEIGVKINDLEKVALSNSVFPIFPKKKTGIRTSMFFLPSFGKESRLSPKKCCPNGSRFRKFPLTRCGTTTKSGCRKSCPEKS